MRCRRHWPQARRRQANGSKAREPPDDAKRTDSLVSLGYSYWRRLLLVHCAGPDAALAQTAKAKPHSQRSSSRTPPPRPEVHYGRPRNCRLRCRTCARRILSAVRSRPDRGPAACLGAQRAQARSGRRLRRRPRRATGRRSRATARAGKSWRRCRILEAGYVVLPLGGIIENNRLYVWPYFAEVPLETTDPGTGSRAAALWPVTAR